ATGAKEHPALAGGRVASDQRGGLDGLRLAEDACDRRRAGDVVEAPQIALQVACIDRVGEAVAGGVPRVDGGKAVRARRSGIDDVHVAVLDVDQHQLGRAGGVGAVAEQYAPVAVGDLRDDGLADVRTHVDD